MPFQSLTAFIIIIHQISNSNLTSFLNRLPSMKAVNLLGPQLHALESFSKDQMKHYFVHFANWALQGDMDTKKVMVTEGSKSHRINIIYPLSTNLFKILSICLKGYPYLEVASKILLFIQITHIPLKKFMHMKSSKYNLT